MHMQVNVQLFVLINWAIFYVLVKVFSKLGSSRQNECNILIRIKINF